MAGRPCKVCGLKKTHPEAYRLISEEIKKDKGKAKIKQLLNTLKKRFDLDINGVNIHRHKTHLASNTHEIDQKDLKKGGKQKETLKTGAFLSNSVNTLTFPDLDPQHTEYLMHYRANGYKNKEEAAKLAGFKDPKKIYEVMKRQEVQAALFELRSIDFINLRITGNQIIAGLGKIAHHPEIKHLMYDENGELITNIHLWPEDLRLALQAVEKEMITTTDQDGNEMTKEKYKFKFESSAGAFKELRKHFMEVDLYKLGEEKRQIHERAVAILQKRREEDLNLTETMQLFEIEGLPFPESLKLEIKDFDWELEKRIKKAEDDAQKALTITSGNQ